MQWGNFRRSRNVEIARGGGGGGFRMGGGKLGIGAVVIVLLASWGLGIDPSVILGALTGDGGSGQSYTEPQSYTENSPQGQTAAAQNPDAPFVAAVLGETEDRWTEILAPRGVTYEAPKLVLFSGVTRSACGTAASAMGPFYCPNDRRIYLDTEFFREIQTRLGGCEAGAKSCEFSEAYVIAHEVGHHVQNLLGILPKAEAAEARASDTEANRIQVRVELQADCFAGLWANKAQAKWNFLEDGDVDAALQTATAIGDDTLQKRAQGYVVPDAFTHGTAAQRKHWFVTGLKGGSIESCDTFAADAP
ncbi:MAG TPA: neutral zinc metallopeptidase [Verrucomicrobiae bacterium]|nr:neutral zinc metallopeptidase [Verrucomicrobiae bacterium]